MVVSCNSGTKWELATIYFTFPFMLLIINTPILCTLAHTA
jgi:hypothetical protein